MEQHLDTLEEEHALGSWNVVTTKVKSKAKKEQAVMPKETQPSIKFIASKVQQLEETSDHILNLRKQQPKISNALFSKELLHLGHVVTTLRKRKKTSIDFTGGDLVLSSGH
ncbi:hypothetical protein MA16_Dca024426 [Dendrobium catenatum]|uniref:Uncharacterized protein n=1 Tax=Dendrobium catenatum TaxID=906689 RepID=A0A2I0W4Y8_9ASPA|nr:hypothetical protein MA16_Dca024426 [Dendrobium catenatum]